MSASYDLVVIGGGSAGLTAVDLAAQLGVRVALVERGHIGGDCTWTGCVPSKALIKTARVAHQMRTGNRFCSSHQRPRAGQLSDLSDTLLLAAGRRPNVDGLDLERAGVRYDERGIQADGHLRTSQRHVYAAGDGIGSYQFTHYAGWQEFIAARNALLPGKSKGVADWVPWTTFTDPEIAHAGLTEEQVGRRTGTAPHLHDTCHGLRTTRGK